MLLLLLIPSLLLALFALLQWWLRGYWYRRVRGGCWQKIWYNRHYHGGYEVWERARPGFDWGIVGGIVMENDPKPKTT